MDVIVPCKTNKNIENSNQTISHPSLSTQGYNHQLQPAMWSGSKVCQNNSGQSTNMDPYAQQMNHYYQSPYSSQNPNDMNRYVSPVSKDQNSNAVAYSPQYPVARQNNYSCTNAAQNYASVKSNCSNMYYGNVNVSKNYQTSNMVQSPKKYANSSLNVSQAPPGVQHNSQISHSIKSPLPPMPHYGEQSNYHIQNAYVNNCNPHSVAENQQTYLVRQTLPSPSLLQSQDNASVQALSMAQGNQVSQVSSIPTPPETSLPGDVISVLDNASPDGSAESLKMNVSSSSFVLPGSTVSHMPSNMSSPVSSIGNNVNMSNRNIGSSLQPPANLDEGSQASSASASSSIPDDQNSAKANSKPNFSYPPTPNTLSSPGAASMSSFHDDLECISSPGWPKTPASPVATSNYEFANIKRPENLLKLYSLSDEPDRRYFLDKLIVFNEERGSPITQCPTISKQPLDVYRVYLTVKERGGFVEVTNAKRWKDIAGAIGVGASSSAAYTLRKQYMKLLLPFECKFDRGGIDPQPIINMVEASSRKKGKAPPTSAYGNQNMYGQGYSQAMDRYSGYPGSYPQRYPCSSNVDYQCAPNSMHYPQTVQHTSPHNTVSGQNQYNQYSHTSQANYGYYQGSSSSNAPMYNNMQNNVSSDICRYGSNATSSSVPQEQTYYPHHYSTQQGQNMPDNIYGSNRSCSIQESLLPPSSSQVSADHDQHKSYPKVNALNASSLTSDSVQHQKSAIDVYGNVNNSASSATEPITDNKICYNNNFTSVNKLVASEHGAGVASSCTSSPSQSYQQPAESAVSKGPDVEYCATLASSHVPANPYPNQNPGTYSNHSSSPYTNQKMHYQNDYQCKDQVQSSQYVQYNEAQNETYRGSEGPPIYQMDRPRSTVEGSSIPSKGYQYNCNPPKANAYPYAAQQRSKDMFNNASYCNQFNSGTPRPWHPEQNQFAHSTGARPQLKNQLNIDPKPNLEGPRIRKSWLNQREANQGQNKHPNTQPTSVHQQNFPNKPQVHSNAVSVSQAFQSMVKKPIEFPPNCIESIKPVAVKRRRCPAKRLGTVDPWRVMLALKSGLLVESTWALDALSILLADNSTVVYFGLSHLPGLLNVLVDHYRCFLNNIFDLAPDMEIGNDEQSKKNECEDLQFSSEDCDLEEKMRILDTPNFTYKTRCNKKVQIQYDEALFLIDPSRSWEKYEGFDVLQEHWQKGGSDITAHIQTFFDSCSKKVKFFRELDNDKTKHKNGKSPLKAKPPVSKENPNVLKSSLLYKGEPVVVLKKFNFLANKISELSDPESDADMDDDISVISINSSITKKTSENGSVKMEDTDKNSLDFSECLNKTDENIKSEFSTSDNSMQDDSCDNDEIKTKSLQAENLNLNEESMQSEKSCEKEDTGNTGNVPQLRGSLSSRKRFLCEELEDEAYCFDQPALCIMNDSQDMLSRRCVCVSQILRNLSFVPGNDLIMSKNAGVLLLMGRLLLLHHEHKPTKNAYRKYEKEADGILSQNDDSCISLKDEQEWWWSTLNVLRENTLVLLSNISGQLDLAPFPEEVSLPILDGLLHWIVCPSSYAQDPLPSRSPSSVLSPQRLSLEALCKLSVLSSNVDLIIATPPWSRIENLFAFLTKSLSCGQDQLVRELSVVLLSNLSQADCVAARTIAEQNSCISYLIAFIEEAEANAFQIASSQGTKKLRDKPELMGTTPGMVQRAANTLKNLALVPENQVLFMKHQPRLLSLVMSQVMDQELAAIIADVLFYCSEETTGDILNLFPLS